MRLAQELHCHLCVWKEFSHQVCHMSHPWLFCHASSSMCTSSSSPTYPTTQQEHSVHPAHLHDHPVDKLRQESLWRKDLQSGGNPRTTTSHRSWVQRTCDRLKDQRLFWRSISYRKNRRRRSPSSDHRRKKPCYVMLTFETRIHRMEWFAQVNIISVSPKLKILRIGDVPVKQRGDWPTISWN